MRLDHLCDLEITVNESQALVKPFGGEEGSLFVLGGGTVTGERLRGRIRCANQARRRNDGAMLPDVSGVITTDDDAAIVFHMQGLTTWQPTAEGPKGDQISWIRFETDSAAYHWLNDARCVLEGTVQLIAGRGATGPCRVYMCTNEML